jgi:hypothetical protein
MTTALPDKAVLKFSMINEYHSQKLSDLVILRLFEYELVFILLDDYRKVLLKI